MSLIQLASLQKIVVALADHLLFGILGNQPPRMRGKEVLNSFALGVETESGEFLAAC